MAATAQSLQVVRALVADSRIAPVVDMKVLVIYENDQFAWSLAPLTVVHLF
jgi:hypothetical protein